MKLSVGVLPISPWAYLRNNVVQEGVFLDIMTYALTRLNLTFDPVVSSDRQLGYRLPNGTWTSTFGMLQQKDVYMVLGPMALTEERKSTFNHTITYFPTSFAVLASVGKIGSNSFFGFLLSYDSKIWCALLLIFVCLIFASAMFDSHGQHFWKTFKYSLWNYFWMYLASLFSEGSIRRPSSRRSQFLLGLWLLGILTLMNAFCGQFKAFLMIQGEEEMLYTIKHMADKPHVIPLLLANTSLEYSFKGAKDKEFKRVYKNALLHREEALITTKKFVSKETYQTVKDGKNYLILDPLMGDAFLSKLCTSLEGNRRFYYIEEKFFFHDYTFYLSSHFPLFLKRILNRRMSSMREAGLLHHWISKYLRDLWKCVQTDKNEEDAPLAFEHLSSIFLLSLVQHVLNILVFIAERIMASKLV